MGSIFISYRRAGTSGYGGRLQEDLRHHFGRGRVFRDIDSIRPGSDFTQVIEQAVARSGIVLVLIGANWLHVTNSRGKRRLKDPDDFVRLEVESALKHGIVVVPVLVEGARMPSPTDLPASMSRLGRMQAIEVTDERWDYDLHRLITVLEEVVGPPADDPANRTAEHAAVAMAAPPAWALAEPDPAPGSAPPLPAPATGGHALPDAAPADAPSAEEPARPVRLASRVRDTAARSGARFGRVVRERRLRVVAAVGTVVLLLGVLVGVTTAGAAPTRKVPVVVERDLAAAKQALERAGFVVETEERPDGRPGGIVLGSDPAGGTAARKGSAIRLFVSANADTLAVPSVTQLARPDAVAAIEAAGLVASVVEQQNDVAAAGTVIGQSPEAMTAVGRGSTVTITVSTGTVAPTSVPGTAPPTTGPEVTTVPGSTPTSAGTPPTAPPTTPRPTVPPTKPPLPPLTTGNLVANPGAENSGESAPFTVGQAPAGWRRGSDQPIAAAYGASGTRDGCTPASYPTVGALQGSGRRLFTGGYDAGGGCNLAGGSTPRLVQTISLSPYAGRTDGVGWDASARLASYPGSGDAAELTVNVLGGGGRVLTSGSTGPVSNASGPAFQTRSLRGQLPPGATAVEVVLSFPVSNSYSGGFADDVLFKLG